MKWDVQMQTEAVIVGGGTMGADVAVVVARGGCAVTVVEPDPEKRGRLPAQMAKALPELDSALAPAGLDVVSELGEVDWTGVDLVIECIPEQLELKQRLFAELDRLAPAQAQLTSNSSSFPISAIAQSLQGRRRMYGLHFFMPAHLVPLVEVVLGKDSDQSGAERLAALMRRCGSVPVLVRRDKPGFLANRLQHALAREAFALIDEGVATPEDVDAAVRFGFGFRFLAAGPVLQRDHAGLDVHCAAAATIYPSLCNSSEPARVLRDHVRCGRTGMKDGAGFFDWAPERAAAERTRYDMLLRRGLELLAGDLATCARP